MRYFDFDDLIDRYSCEFEVINHGEGSYNDLGDWVAGEANQGLKRGAIISIRDSKIYQSNGVLTVEDKELFMKEPLGKIDKTFVIHDGNKYKVEANPQNNHEFTGVWQYTLKWISAFKGRE